MKDLAGSFQAIGHHLLVYVMVVWLLHQRGHRNGVVRVEVCVGMGPGVSQVCCETRQPQTASDGHLSPWDQSQQLVDPDSCQARQSPGGGGKNGSSGLVSWFGR